MTESLFKRQVLPLSLTVLVCAAMIGLLWLEIKALNQFTTNDIVTRVRWVDITIGLTVYLKTSIDFAVFIGRLMKQNSDWKSRISIEIGTAFGNALGTMGVLLLWTFFKEVRWLLATMIFLASLVLFRLADDALAEHLEGVEKGHPIVHKCKLFLEAFNRVTHPVLRFILPNLKTTEKRALAFWPLMVSAFTVPFILGLDDFAGYVPIFNIVNVFGFGIGVFVGHMILNALLYISPERTIQIIRNHWISLAGSLAFVGLGIWGLIEVVRMFTEK